MTPESAPTILVIEDYSDTRELLSSLLRRKGYNVLEAENGKEGVLEATYRNPDLILMDLALPEMDGVEAAELIHRVPKLSQTPIFVVSAYATEEVKADALAAGCTEIFTKPIEVEALLEKIRETLGPGSGLPTTDN
jgi:CheY-like chemotaxis protein